MLPALREELALLPGPRALDGAPTWTLHDPVRNQFFAIDWLTFEILARWHLGKPEAITAAIEEQTPIHLDPGDLEAVVRFLAENELVQNFGAKGTAWFRDQMARRQQSPAKRLLHGYLFFRLPLWRPDRWLGRALPWVRPLASPLFGWLTLAALALGLVETSRQWETFMASLVDTVSLQGLMGFAVALVFAKVMHELGHAFVAKAHGCRVPTMGVAFLLLFPMAYTDVNEVWKLRGRRQRLQVGAAGIRTELVIAAWATLLWALLPDGAVRSGVFILATTTWVTTLLINASPFLRFDGYFLLMDWLRMPNLHQRAFALGRWRLREVLFGLGDAPPEALAAGRRRGLIAFAYGTWLYRLIVFGGIAILVYSIFPKPLGPALAAIEVWWFILAPVWKEVKEWGGDMDRLKTSRRLRLVGVGALGLLLVGVLPWDGRIAGQGVLRPAGSYTLIVPAAVRVTALPVADGAVVRRGDVVAELDSPDLEAEQRQTEARAATARWQSGAAGVDSELLAQSQVIAATRARLEAELTGVSEERDRFVLRAPVDGVLRHADLDLRPGQWVGRNEHLLTVVEDGPWQVVTYLTEAELDRIAVGARAAFYPEAAGGARLSLRVDSIDRDATRLLSDGLLASTRGGTLLVRETSAGPVPEGSVFRVVLSLPDADVDADATPPAAHHLRGKVVIFGQRKAPLSDFARAAAALVVREGSF